MNSMSICGGCDSEIGHGPYIQIMGVSWHPECLRCHRCEKPISNLEFAEADNRLYHGNCYEELYHPRCDVCKHFIPLNADRQIEYREHPFWKQKYCPSHEHDGTTRCCSCERMEPLDAKYRVLDDDRKLCLKCSNSAIMDTQECQPLYLQVQEFFESLNIKVKDKIPLLLVEAQELNAAMEGEKNGHHCLSETRGLCLSEEQSISKILRQPRFGNFRIIDMFTEPYRLIRRCAVTAIMVLYGLPELLTGSILAHEMMHAWLRLNGYFNLSADVEEGMCQLLAHTWLHGKFIKSRICKKSDTRAPVSREVIWNDKTAVEQSEPKKLVEFFMQQIELHSNGAYREGFEKAKKAYNKYGLKKTLDHILLASCFPP